MQNVAKSPANGPLLFNSFIFFVGGGKRLPLRSPDTVISASPRTPPLLSLAIHCAMHIRHLVCLLWNTLIGHMLLERGGTLGELELAGSKGQPFGPRPRPRQQLEWPYFGGGQRGWSSGRGSTYRQTQATPARGWPPRRYWQGVTRKGEAGGQPWRCRRGRHLT